LTNLIANSKVSKLTKDHQNDLKKNEDEMDLTESLVNKDYSAKLVLCLRNRISKKEQIFSLKLDELNHSSLINFHGEVKDLFSKNHNNIGVLRKIDVNYYEDIMSSYDSILTETKKAKKNRRKNTKKSQVSNKWDDVIKSEISKNFNKFDPKGKAIDNSYHLNNYTIFSFVDIKSNPYLKIKKKNNIPIRDNRDLHISLTNLEDMTNFFVKIKIKSKCDQSNQLQPQITFLAKAKLKDINNPDSFYRHNMKKISNQGEVNQESEVKKENMDIKINWAVKKNLKKESFYHSRKYFYSNQ
jgi:hypothetical protein